MVEHMLCIYEVLGSIFSTPKIKLLGRNEEEKSEVIPHRAWPGSGEREIAGLIFSVQFGTACTRRQHILFGAKYSFCEDKVKNWMGNTWQNSGDRRINMRPPFIVKIIFVFLYYYFYFHMIILL